ncbi:MAG: hypothetical protein K8S55_10695 [Phycisphaerae bacterium]|nr:hypothetical protein [Phycisphaerae bacterium]
MIHLVNLSTGNKTIDTAFRIAMGDFLGNIKPWQGALPDTPEHCIMAGLDYDKPWTRDAAFNSWYAGSIIAPKVAVATLTAVLVKNDRGLRVGGQYWDSIIWVTGAWQHYLYTGDKEFLATAFEAAGNSLAFLEETELDPADGLFRGGACFQDGISGYPDRFADNLSSSCILDWVDNHPAQKVKTGHGLPIKALSTNCLYYNAYRILGLMAAELQQDAVPEAEQKASRLREAINHRFWNPDSGSYRYLVDADDTADRQEGLGHAFAILFGIADEHQVSSIFERQHITEHGIACVWPQYERYANAEGTSFARHSGTVWPQVNVAWALAAAHHGRRAAAYFELQSLAEKACRDNQYSEIYHPITGEIYGGMQEAGPSWKPAEWNSCQRQTWCATGYLQMVFSVLFGMRLTSSGIEFDPYLPDGVDRMVLRGFRYRNSLLNIVAERGKEIQVKETLI